MGKFCIYKHTCPNGKVYIGKTCRKPEYRWGNNGDRYYTSPHFWNAINKYGWDNINHEILYTDLSNEEACELEIKLIAEHKSNDRRYGYNITAGGEGSLGRKHTEEWKQFMRDRMTGDKNGFYGKKHSDEMKKHWSEMKKGKGGKPVSKIDKLSGEVIAKYSNMKVASEENHIDRGSINKCCLGQLKSAGGYLWSYDTDF